MGLDRFKVCLGRRLRCPAGQISHMSINSWPMRTRTWMTDAWISQAYSANQGRVSRPTLHCYTAPPINA
eukprot:scaffold600499_cov32-Prasinocladus_malaysianus.AAC.1